jgi:F0F1-type ATP synthase membrane subunit b/b'
MNLTELYDLVKEGIEFIKKPLFILIDERTKEIKEKVDSIETELKEKVEPKLEKIDAIEKN